MSVLHTPPLRCSHRPPCSACPRFGEPGIASTARLTLDGLADRHGAVVSAGCPDAAFRGAAFRLRARLAIRGRVGSPKIGLFEHGTHRVVHVPNCVVHHPLINRVAGIVRRALVDARVSCFSDAAHLGLARYLQVVVERSSQTAQVVLVANHRDAGPLQECLGLIQDRLGRELHSLWFNANCERANTILGSQVERIVGPDSVVEHFGGAAVHYPPGAFGQSNLDVADRIIAHVRAEIPEGSRVTEFYAGVGAIGLSILPRVSQIILNEVSPPSLHGLELGMGGLAADDRRKVTVVRGTAGKAAAAASDAEVVIADPPRKGLDPELIDQLRTQPPERLLYISCGLDSLVRDTADLTATGSLRLAALTAFDLLPYTDHVETVARFERSSPLRPDRS